MMKKNIKKPATLREKGQVLVVVALTIMMLLAIIGLAVDTGYVYVSYSRLTRAVDAAALAATGEFKRNYTITGMTASAKQELKLNGIIVDANTDNPDVVVTVETCSNAPGDPELCPSPGKLAQKLVRIVVTQDVPTFFMATLGWYRIPITVKTIAQAASIDLVLLIQNSEAMTFENGLAANKDPNVCNPNGCHPFEEIKAAAKDFVTQLMYFPYDRVSLVTFNKTAKVVLPLSDQSGGDTITPALTNLTVYNPPQCNFSLEDVVETTADPTVFPYPRNAPLFWDPDPSTPGTYSGYTADPQQPCRAYARGGGGYQGNLSCPMFFAASAPFTYTSDNDASWCGTTNPAAGLAMAGNHLQGAYNYVGENPAVPTTPITVRDDAVWVILLLATGAPNSAQDDDSKALCPKSSLNANPASPNHTPGCRDNDVLTRHCYKITDITCINAKFDVTDTNTVFMTSTYDPTHYDAYDRAFDMVDVQVANSVYIFTIGLGAQTQSSGAGAYPIGETFLKYAAKVGGGIYKFAPNGAGLKAIFLQIANKIATKLTQ